MKCVHPWSSCAVGLALLAASPSMLPAQWNRVAAPTGVAVTLDASALTVSWNNMTNASSYQVNRRSPEAALDRVTSSPYSAPLTEPGVFYEYQVVSIGPGRNNRAASPWVGYTVPASSRPGVVVTDPRPPRGTPTPIPAGPTLFTARSGIPGQIQLTWREVANATAYRVMRSSNEPQPEGKLVEYSSQSQMPGAGLWSHTDAPVDMRYTYTYKVYALFGTSLSTPSPVAVAASIPVPQPTDLKYAVTLTRAPGMVNVTLSWTGVPNIAHYGITGAGFAGSSLFTTTATSYTFTNVPASRIYPGICVGAIYPYSIGDPATAPCVDIKLK